MPLIGTDVIVSKLKDSLDAANVDVEVFEEFPAKPTDASEGLYAARFYQESRTMQSLTLEVSGSVYEVVDRLELYLMKGQLDPVTDQVLAVLEDFIDDPIFEGYYKKEQHGDQAFINSSECYRTVISLTRTKTIT